MKKILFLLIAITMVACNNNQSYTIKIQLPELADLQLELRQTVEGEMIVIDSVTLDSVGMGKISGSIEAPEMVYLGEKGQRRAFPIFLDNYKYTVSGTVDDVKVEADGGAQLAYNEYVEGTKAVEEKQKAIVAKFYEAQAAQVSEDSLAKIYQQYEAIGLEKTANDSAYMAENPSSVVSVFILRGVYYQMNAEELEAKLAVFDESVRKTSYYTFMAAHLEKMQKVAIGQKFVDFELPDVDGNPVKLSDLAGNGVLLIDFWASWCGPCRRANPGVVEIYNEFHDKGFDILGVSLDRTREEWLQGISEDGLIWNHVSDIKFWQSEAAQLYAVSSIPHTVLLDKDGTIVARPQNEEELRAKVQELLGE